jgi:glutamate synthase domain-containing protein 3
MKLLIDAKDLEYRELNSKVRNFLNGDDNDGGSNDREVIIKNALGHRYIGDGLKGDALINIYGTPGNDLGAFMDGPTIEIFGNGQDGIGNTMNSGKIIVHGDAGDILGYSMRGGEIFIEKSIGFRGGIHMKSYREKVPVIVIGGSAGNFLGEYMAGGIIILLGLHKKERAVLPFTENPGIAGNYTGTGMHGGKIYIRGNIEDHKLGKEVRKSVPDKNDLDLLDKYITSYCDLFNIDRKKISNDSFLKLVPYSNRPYGKLYSY